MAELLQFDYPIPADARIRKIWGQMSSIRHDVYADELHQYAPNPARKIEDPGRHFLVYVRGDDLVGFISLNPPECQPFRLTTYFSDDALRRTVFGMCKDFEKSAFEVRGLTVAPAYRGLKFALRLMCHAQEFVVKHGGTDIVAMGHAGVAKMYENNGMKVFRNEGVTHGAAVYFPMHKNVHATRATIEDMQKNARHEASEAVCFHGGQSWHTSKFDFDVRDSFIVADVLDSPFPPCPDALRVIREQLDRCCMESPPTQCQELVETIAEVRHISTDHLAVSSGSSSLMYSLMPKLLTQRSRVLVLSPMYSEYQHILRHVIGCDITYFVLKDHDEFSIDADELIAQACVHDAVILVNPNSPTGMYCDHMTTIARKVARSQNPDSICRLIWIDETYIDYLTDAVSLEYLCTLLPELVICKSMSKCYALSGLRVAYAVSQSMPTLRRFIPPWAVSLPGQLGAIAALRNKAYYVRQYEIVHDERRKMQRSLQELGFRVFPGVANYLLAYLPAESGFSSAEFVKKCTSMGLFLRDAHGMGVSLPNIAVRLAVRMAKQNEQLIHIVGCILSSRRHSSPLTQDEPLG